LLYEVFIRSLRSDRETAQGEVSQQLCEVQMMDSPCHHCPECPCKKHDTCKDYLEYRAVLDKQREENLKAYVTKEYVVNSIHKRKRKERYK